jgi:hypothetical protein
MKDGGLLSDRSVIRIDGEDRRSFLQGIVSQDMAKLSPGAAVFAALLTPQGKILFDFFVIENGGHYSIDCRRDASEALVKRLTLYKLRAEISLVLDESKGVFVSPEKIDASVAYRDPRHLALGWRAIMDAAESAAHDDDSEYDKRRIGLGVPEWGEDFGSGDMFLLDVNYDALNGVSFEKGCFVGQEVTSRMKRKGAPPRRTLIARFQGAPPQKGATIEAGGVRLGQILSAADGAALALIRLDRWEKAKAEGAAPLCEGCLLELVAPDYLKPE